MIDPRRETADLPTDLYANVIEVHGAGHEVMTDQSGRLQQLVHRRAKSGYAGHLRRRERADVEAEQVSVKSREVLGGYEAAVALNDLKNRRDNR